VPKSNAPKAMIAGLEVIAVERLDQALQQLRQL
jgi:DNA repair protein RadA/Sms